MSNLKVFLDTNILFTTLKKEEEFYRSCYDLRLLDYRYCISTLTLFQIQGYTCYRRKSKVAFDKNVKFLNKLVTDFEVLTTKNTIIENALKLNIMTDIEDNIQLMTALYYGCNVIVTNDKKFISIFIYRICNRILAQ